MIIFENPGEIDIAAISTFGVSVKESENPIGFFGTGLKYALAILIRGGHKVTMWSGEQRLDFGSDTVAIRGKDFNVVTINGERQGFTTDVGKTWKLWMAYRELFCNARDENGDAYRSNALPDPQAGITRIAVEGDAFEGIHNDRWKYFIEDEPDLAIEGMQIWRRPSVSFFYRGVNVMALPRAAILTYNDTNKLELTEDRTVKDSYLPPYRIARSLLKLTDENLLREVLMAKENTLEHALDFHGWTGTTPSAEFLRTVGKLVNDGLTNVNATAKRVWEEQQSEVFSPKETALTDVQRMTLNRALTFCNKIGFSVQDYPVRVVESLGANTLGLAKNEIIYVAEKNFHQGGAKQVAATLIEEYVHLRHTHHDLTREMQNYLLERMVSLGEELVGEPL